MDQQGAATALPSCCVTARSLCCRPPIPRSSSTISPTLPTRQTTSSPGLPALPWLPRVSAWRVLQQLSVRQARRRTWTWQTRSSRPRCARTHHAATPHCCQDKGGTAQSKNPYVNIDSATGLPPPLSHDYVNVPNNALCGLLALRSCCSQPSRQHQATAPQLGQRHRTTGQSCVRATVAPRPPSAARAAPVTAPHDDDDDEDPALDYQNMVRVADPPLSLTPLQPTTEDIARSCAVWHCARDVRAGLRSAIQEQQDAVLAEAQILLPQVDACRADPSKFKAAAKSIWCGVKSNAIGAHACAACMCRPSRNSCSASPSSASTRSSRRC